jgi:stage IV sporulation protein FB
MRENNEYIKMSRLCVLLIFIATIIGKTGEVLIVYACVLMHECAHLAVCKKLKVPTLYMAITPYGMELKLKRLATPKEQIKISLAGPILNLFLFLGGYIFLIKGVRHHLLSFFTSANFILMIFNLLPCSPLDGGEIFKSLMSKKHGILNSYKILYKISRIFGAIFFISGAIFFYHRLNITLLIIALLVYQSIKKQRNSSIYATKEILTGKIRSKDKIKCVRFFPETRLCEVISYISFDYTLYAVFEKNGLTFSLAQKDILKAVKKNPCLSLMDVENYKIL